MTRARDQAVSCAQLIDDHAQLIDDQVVQSSSPRPDFGATLCGAPTFRPLTWARCG